MNEPRIAVKSREHYNRGDDPWFFHLGHFRVDKLDFPKEPCQTIAAEVYTQQESINGHYPIYLQDMTIGGQVSIKDIVHSLLQAQNAAYQVALAHAKVLADQYKVPVEDQTERSSSGLESCTKK